MSRLPKVRTHSITVRANIPSKSWVERIPVIGEKLKRRRKKKTSGIITSVSKLTKQGVSEHLSALDGDGMMEFKEKKELNRTGMAAGLGGLGMVAGVATGRRVAKKNFPKDLNKWNRLTRNDKALGPDGWYTPRGWEKDVHINSKTGRDMLRDKQLGHGIIGGGLGTGAGILVGAHGSDAINRKKKRKMDLSALDELTEFKIPEDTPPWRSKRAYRKMHWANQQPEGRAQDLAAAKADRRLTNSDNRIDSASTNRKHPNHKRAKRIIKHLRSLR
jgi:hypothetical protein